MAAAEDRINAFLIPQARAALDVVMKEKGLNKTDAVNQAIQLYGFHVATTKAGGELIYRYPDGTSERVVVL